jgi:hypothetical protein
VTIKTSPGTQFTTGEVFGFKTTGADMVGMTVNVCLLDGDCETSTWQETGDTSGGAVGKGWRLNLLGDSFDESAAFILNTDTGVAVSSFTMDGRPGLTTFDIASTEDGSPGSLLGFPFRLAEPVPSKVQQINVLYSDQLGVEGKFYGDLYLVMQVTFEDAGGFSGELSFQTDTDNTGVIERFEPNPVPEPASLALAAAGLGLLAALGRHRRRR